jgi:hypothetical protein
MERITVRVEPEQKKFLEDRVEEEAVENESEEVRSALWGRMAEFGRGHGENSNTSRLAGAFRKSAKYLFVAALTWLGVTVWFPFSYRTPALVLLLAAASCVLCGEVVQQYDVRPLAWLRERRRGEQA